MYIFIPSRLSQDDSNVCAPIAKGQLGSLPLVFLALQVLFQPSSLTPGEAEAQQRDSQLMHSAVMVIVVLLVVVVAVVSVFVFVIVDGSSVVTLRQ